MDNDIIRDTDTLFIFSADIITVPLKNNRFFIPCSAATVCITHNNKIIFYKNLNINYTINKYTTFNKLDEIPSGFTNIMCSSNHVFKNIDGHNALAAKLYIRNMYYRSHEMFNTVKIISTDNEYTWLFGSYDPIKYQIISDINNKINTSYDFILLSCYTPDQKVQAIIKYLNINPKHSIELSDNCDYFF